MLHPRVPCSTWESTPLLSPPRAPGWGATSPGCSTRLQPRNPTTCARARSFFPARPPGGCARSSNVFPSPTPWRRPAAPPSSGASGPACTTRPATLRAALPEGVELRIAGPGHGYVTDDELVGLYRRAALLVLPSLYEGFGFPLIEAMACGTPCIASDDPALVEVSGGAALHFPRS